MKERLLTVDEAVPKRGVPHTRSIGSWLAGRYLEYFAYYRTTSRPRSVVRYETSWRAVRPVLGGKRLVEEISPFDLERYLQGRK